jgi:hypothetical protein
MTAMRFDDTKRVPRWVLRRPAGRSGASAILIFGSVIRLDVEGHEAAALRGLCRTVQSHRPAILLEFNPEVLPANGSSVPELLELLAGWGYVPHTMGVVWSRLAREWRLRRVPESWRPTRTGNVLFFSPDGVHAVRLRRYIQSGAALDGAHTPEPP